VHPWRLAGTLAFSDAQSSSIPASWERTILTDCVIPTVPISVRTTVAEAWKVLCSDATAAGVQLRALDGLREPSEQAKLFRTAIKQYGSEIAARRHVAYATDDYCTSKHCTGVAIDVAAGDGLAWLSSTVACADGTTVRTATTCTAAERPLPRLARYGFTQPLVGNPAHIEFTLPLPGLAGTGSSDCRPAGVPVAQMVASIFRCRAQLAGWAPGSADRLAAEAVAVAHCESRWNPSARAWSGRWRTDPDPRDGRTYTGVGVFMLPIDLDVLWRGEGSMTDPLTNIHAAASLVLADGDWAGFSCAVGGPSNGFGTGPVLPAHGGPALPEWAYGY
jgi:hypothetical protein